MRNIKDEPSVKELLDAENQVTKDYLNDVSNLKDTIFDELKSRELETYQTAPYKHGEFLYYERFEAGKEYAIHCRKKIGTDKEQICLDENELAEGLEYFSLGFFDVSSDHKILAYCCDTDGSELYTLKFKNLVTGEIYSDEIKRLAASGCWFKDSYTYAYVIQDENQRPYKVLSHTLKGDTEDTTLYTEKNPGEYFVHVNETHDYEFIIISSNGAITSKSLYMSASDPSDTPKLIHEHERGLEYYIDHKDGFFYITTNDEHKNFRIAKVSDQNPAKSNWKEFISGSDSEYINSFSCYKDYFVLNYKEDGLNKLEVIYNDGARHDIEFPEVAYNVSDGDNAEFDTAKFRYDYTSPTSPFSSYDFDINQKVSTKIYEKEVPGFDATKYEVKRVNAKSHDGVDIPITIFHKKNLQLNGNNPSLLYGYGSYSYCINPGFNTRVLSLVDRGFVYAIGHIRGSSTMGRQWYEDGKFLKKKNTFLDFNSCAQYLIDNNYSSKGEIVINGGSAGGLLVGASVNLAPVGQFKAVVAEVPFVDTLNTMLDSSLPLTEAEYDEWGNPNEEEYYNYIKSYSPYDNIEAKEYPATLATGGLNDPRVTYWEPMKWIYRLRDISTDSNPKLLYMNMDAGHGGASGRFEYLKEDAMIYSFILKQFNIKE